jgi:CRP-like cAMP-binding protein
MVHQLLDVERLVQDGADGGGVEVAERGWAGGLNHDRAGSDEIAVTQEFLGLMLGTRRATINEAMGQLAASGSIEHRRGRVRILDRAPRVAELRVLRRLGRAVRNGLRICA